MPRAGQQLPNPKKSDYLAIIQRLRVFWSVNEIATILGRDERRLDPSDEQGIGVAAARLAYVLLRIMESPHIPISPIEIICLGKWETFYDPAQDKTTQENSVELSKIIAQIKELSENPPPK